MKRLLLILYSISLNAMENPEHPRYHINGKVVFLKELHESGDQEFRTVSEFNKTFQEIPVNEPKPTDNDIAIIQTGISNRHKFIIATITAGGSIVSALISGLLTYYTTACKK